MENNKGLSSGGTLPEQSVTQKLFCILWLQGSGFPLRERIVGE